MRKKWFLQNNLELVNLWEFLGFSIGLLSFPHLFLRQIEQLFNNSEKCVEHLIQGRWDVDMLIQRSAGQSLCWGLSEVFLLVNLRLQVSRRKMVWVRSPFCCSLLSSQPCQEDTCVLLLVLSPHAGAPSTAEPTVPTLTPEALLWAATQSAFSILATEST